MVLSEQFTNRLKQLAGIQLITEADNRSVIVDKIGLPQFVADWANNLSKKYAIWIANSFKLDVVKDMSEASVNANLDKEAIRAEILSNFKGDNTQNSIKEKLKSAMPSYGGRYSFILDWITRRSTLAQETDQLNFKTLTFNDALHRADVWHEEIGKLAGGQIKDEEGDVVLTYTNGFYWIRLNVTSCSAEANAMGHCGRAMGKGQLYSLRQNKQPYITTEYNPENGIIYQMKGKANTKPKANLHEYIYDFITNPRIGVKGYESAYRRETDFNIADFSQALFDKLMKVKPELIKSYPEAIGKLSPAEVYKMFHDSRPDYDTYSVYGKVHYIRLTADLLMYLLNTHTVWFFKNKLTAYLEVEQENPGVPPIDASQLINTILYNHNYFAFLEAGNIKIEDWLLTPEQKDFLITKEIEGSALLANQNISEMKFSPEQLDRMVKELQTVFENQDLNDLSKILTKEQKFKLLEHAPFADKQKVKFLGEDFKSFYDAHPEEFNSLMLSIKYGKGYEEIETDTVPRMEGAFTPAGVEIWFDEWQDENLYEFYADEDAIKQILNYELDMYSNYDYKFSDLQYNFDDLNTKSIATVKHIIKKAVPKAEVSKMTERELFSFLNSDYKDFVNSLKDSFIRAVENAQSNADEGEYHDLATKPLEDLLGKPEWVTKKAKIKDAEGKEKIQDKSFLVFKITYKEFLEHLENAEDYDGSDDDYTYFTRDSAIDIQGIIKTSLSEYSEKLKIEEPYGGVNGDIDNAFLNEEFENKLYENLPKIMDKIKFVKKVVKKIAKKPAKKVIKKDTK